MELAEHSTKHLYLESVWWAMHQSDDESRQAAVVTCYLDESGTHEGAALAVVAGLLLNKSGFRAFDEKWDVMLAAHSISPPLHMKDFRRPGGRLADVSNDQRRALFADVVKIVNGHKIYSIAATLTGEQYRKHFDKEFRSEGMSAYAACFMVSAIMTCALAKENHYRERVAFLMDSGNEYAEHVRGAHAVMQGEDWKALNIGSLTFDSDKVWNPLQGADVIAWASRVRGQHDAFTNGYEPLEGLFDAAHEQHAYPEIAMAQLAAKINDVRQVSG